MKLLTRTSNTADDNNFHILMNIDDSKRILPVPLVVTSKIMKLTPYNFEDMLV